MGCCTIDKKPLDPFLQRRLDRRDKTKSLARISPYTGKPTPISQGIQWIAPGGGV